MPGRRIAPAGAPIRAGDLVRWCSRWTRLSASDQELRAAICADVNVRHCWLTSTGRAGLTVLLSSLTSLASEDRNEVVLPSYTCYSVAASIVRAGLRPRIVDVDPRWLDFDLERLGNTDFKRVLAIVSTSLYGLPGRLRDLCCIARDRSVYLVDDAAQSLGAKLHGVPSGAWGDAGLLSFDKGKAVSTIDGGAIVTSSVAVSDAVETRVRTLPRPGARATGTYAVKLLAYATCLRPRMYWLPMAIPGLGLGRTRYDSSFALERQSPWLAALGATMWPHLRQFTASRRANAARYLDGIPDTQLIRPVQPVDGAEPSYLRLPILVGDAQLRAQLLHDLAGVGIGATGSYPGSVADIPEIQGRLAPSTSARAGRSTAASIVTLPTHPYVSARDIDLTLDVIARVVGKGH